MIRAHVHPQLQSEKTEVTGHQLLHPGGVPGDGPDVFRQCAGPGDYRSGRQGQYTASKVELHARLHHQLVPETPDITGRGHMDPIGVAGDGPDKIR